MDTAANKIKIPKVKRNSLTEHFVLSQESWTENYHKPWKKRLFCFKKVTTNNLQYKYRDIKNAALF